MTTKICNGCKEEFPIDSGFPKHPTSKDGYSNLCHKCKYDSSTAFCLTVRSSPLLSVPAKSRQ